MTSQHDRTIFSTVNVEANVYLSGNKKSFDNKSGNPIHRKNLLLKDTSHTQLLWDLPQFSNKRTKRRYQYTHHYWVGKVKNFARCLQRLVWRGKKNCLVKEYKTDTFHNSWIEQLLITPQKTKTLPTNCFPFRRIAPLNTDVKNGRFEHVLPRLVCLEQTGFAKDRHSTDNMLSLPNVLGTSRS